jgi:serine/threonine protein kinase
MAPCAPLVLGDELARGAFGSVYVVDAPYEGQVDASEAPRYGEARKIAVKRVPDPVGHVNRELETCVRLARDPHPNVVRMLGYWTEEGAEGAGPTGPTGPKGPTAPTAPAVLYLAMEFFPETLGGVLARLAESGMRMRTGRMTALAAQLARALGHLERIGLMHRDVKPDNVLVDLHTNRLALCDFGSAKFLGPAGPTSAGPTSAGAKFLGHAGPTSAGPTSAGVTYVCTRNYRAPELILGRDMYSTSVDVWAFGCILGEFAYGRPLFGGDTQVDVLASIIRARGMVTADDIAHMPTSQLEEIDSDSDVGLAGLSGLTALLGPTGLKALAGLSGPKPWSKVFTRRAGPLAPMRRVNASYGEFYERVLDACLQWNPSSRTSAHDLCRDPAWGSLYP